MLNHKKGLYAVKPNQFWAELWILDGDTMDADVGCLDFKNPGWETVMAMTKHVCSNNRWALLNLQLACVLRIKPLQALQHTNNSNTASARLAEFQRKRTQLCSALTNYNQFTVTDFPRLQGQRGVMGCSCSSAESKASWRLPQKSLSLFPSGPPKSPVAAVSRRYSNLPFNSCRTPPSTGLRDASPCPRPVVGHQRAAVLSLFPAPFLNFTVSAELNQFSGGFPISLILQQTALRVRKGSVHIFKGTQAWESTTWLSPLWWRCISPCLPPVFNAALQCVLLHLMGNFKGLLFWSYFRRQPPYGNAFSLPFLNAFSSAIVELGKMVSWTASDLAFRAASCSLLWLRFPCNQGCTMFPMAHRDKNP